MTALSIFLTSNNNFTIDSFKDTINSIFKQSFSDFELIVIGSSISDLIIQLYSDHKTISIPSAKNRTDELNQALQIASGKYIVRVGINDILSTERFAIQHTIMEEEPSVTVCGGLITPIGVGIRGFNPLQLKSGIIKYPLITFLTGNPLFDTTTIIRKDFLQTHKLQYELFPEWEDFRLWTRIAQYNGVFYIEPQSLQIQKLFTTHPTQKTTKRHEVYSAILHDVLINAIHPYIDKYPELQNITDNLYSCINQNLCKESDLFFLLHAILSNIIKCQNHEI